MDGYQASYSYMLVLELKRIYRIFEFGFDSKFVRKEIEIRNIEIPGLKNNFLFLQMSNNKWIACVIFIPFWNIISHYSG